MGPQKALETIGTNLQKQYEKWQPRARYKQSLDPTVEEVKKLCTSLRRNAKDERVLFHYNGHGVPKPTTNGEIWVFNRVNFSKITFCENNVLNLIRYAEKKKNSQNRRMQSCFLFKSFFFFFLFSTGGNGEHRTCTMFMPLFSRH